MTSIVQSGGDLVGPFIDGVLGSTNSDEVVSVINPSNGRHLLSIPVGSADDADRAVVSAHRTFEAGSWSQVPPSIRKRTLHRLADLIERDSAVLDSLDAGEMGKPVSTAAFSAAASSGLMRFYAESIDKVLGDVFPSDSDSLAIQRQVPRGVVAAIVPWNFPTYNAVLKVAPALAAANSVVLKPSELSSRSALHLATLATEAGVPPGTLNVVPGLGETVGRALALHRDVNMIAFTGSTEVGKRMLQFAGQSNMKTVLAECGGKSPQIVFDDGIDMAVVAGSIAGGLVTNQGQVCSVGSRVLVQRSLEMRLSEAIVARTKQIVMGDALDPKTTFGPLASATQYERVMGYIDAAQREGARLEGGGKRALEGSGGYFVEPTVFRDVAVNTRIAQEEIFGPVLSIIPFDDESEAIRIANDTIYGLAAYVWTADLSTGMRVAKAIRSTVLVNSTKPKGEGAAFAASFEPAGLSGVGIEGGIAGLGSYLRRQFIAFHHA